MAVQQQKSETIAAIATPQGTGGIGIIRISGPDTLTLFRQLFHPTKDHASLTSHTLYHGTAQSREGKVLDEVLAVYMRGPNTYTREDVAEIHSHGSSLVLHSILREVFRLGARPAEAGEFTKRAFLAGRIDLTRAEAVIELLQAKTGAGVDLAMGQLQGELADRIEAVRSHLVNLLALLEVAIDFPEDDVELLDRQHMREILSHQVEKPLSELVSLAEQGKILREGISLVIAGLPNVGKSSLLNALLQEERALVTDIPGTTRDTIEEYISIRGIPVRIVDTAGIRNHAGEVELMGIQRARMKMMEADLVLLMIDASRPFSSEDMELYESIGNTNRVVVLNKVDIAEELAVKEAGQRFAGERIVTVSAKHYQGLTTLQDAIYEAVIGDGSSVSERCSCAPNVRHRVILERCLAAAGRVSSCLESGVTADLVAVELQSALDHLGDIVGLTTPDDVLDRIFAEFCIGK